jgi:hypothetical protein
LLSYAVSLSLLGVASLRYPELGLGLLCRDDFLYALIAQALKGIVFQLIQNLVVLGFL